MGKMSSVFLENVDLNMQFKFWAQYLEIHIPSGNLLYIDSPTVASWQTFDHKGKKKDRPIASG